MRPLSILLFISGALAYNEALPVIQPNNTLASELTADIISDPFAKRWTCPNSCSTNICCENGLCVSSLSDVCCGSYYCNAGNRCCGTGCMPSGGDCCSSGKYCPAGEECMIYKGEVVCCPNGDCTQGTVDYYTQRTTKTYTQTTNYYTTTRRTTTYTNVEWTWYSWTVTWTYWVTFYTYYARSTASIRTSTVTTTSTIVSVRATDASDASSSFTRLSATMSYYTPASATNPRTPTDAVMDSGPTFPPISQSGDDGSSSSGGSGSGSNGGSGSIGGISVNGVMGGGDSNAANVNHRLGWEAILTLSIVLGTGFLMVYL